MHPRKAVNILNAKRGRAKRWIKRARLDFADAVTGRRDPMVPPRRLGMPGQLPAVGEVIVGRVFEGAAGLQPTDRVLDIGCSVGRLAVPLTARLDSGSYEGFDIMPKPVRWAQRRITPRHPNFRFQLADIQNSLYNPDGDVVASEYRFPYDDGEFDLAMANSVFTHLVPVETIHYLDEAARVLKPGGRLASSFMLINDEVEELIADGIPDRFMVGVKGLKVDHQMTDDQGNSYRTPHPHRPEHFVALGEEDVVSWHQAAGFRIERILYGSWCGRRVGSEATGHDYVIAVKE